MILTEPIPASVCTEPQTNLVKRIGGIGRRIDS